MKSPLLLASIATLLAIGGVSSPARAHESHRDSGARRQAVDLPSERATESTSRSTEMRAARRDDRHDHAYPAREFHASGMQIVPTTAGPGEPGHGWQYFSDSAAGSAVVISPQGEYFLSRGKGLRLISTAARSGR